MRKIFAILLSTVLLVFAACDVLLPQAAESTIDHASIDNFRSFVTEYALLEPNIIAMEACSGIIWAREFLTGNLMKSANHGETWDFVYAFEKPINAIYADGHGNLFVTVTLDRWAAEGTGEVHKSSDGGETFRKVLDVAAGVPVWWNIASRDGVMFMSEYGFKWDGDNARRIYRSLDFGETWEIIFEPTPMLDYHNHKILITDDGVVYQSIGDGQNAKIIRSFDWGYNWETAVYGFQPTSGIALDGHILWGLDGGPWSGIAWYDRQTGEASEAFVAPKGFRGGPVYDMVMAHGVAYAIILSYEGHDNYASIVYSKDEGATWHLVGYIDGAPEHGIGLNILVADEKFGYIDFGSPIYRDGVAERFRGTLRFELLNIN